MAETSRPRHEDVLSQAALALASELSVDALLQRIVDLARDVSGATYGALGVLAADGRFIREFLTTGITDEQRAAIGHIPRGLGVLGALITDARPLRLERIADDPRSVGFPPNHPPMSSFLGVPVAARGRVFGNLYLTDKAGGRSFTDDDEEAVIRLAAHAGVAIERAQLYGATQLSARRFEALNDIARSILEGHELADVLDLIADRARAILGAALATVTIPDAGDELVIRAASGDRAADVLGARFPHDRSIAGDVMRTGLAERIDDATSDARIYQPVVRLGDMGPVLVVPLEAKGRTFGALLVAHTAGGTPFTDDDKAFLEGFAAQAAVALEHARVNEELQRLALVEERERIAKELHDDIIQSLFAEGMALQAAMSVAHDRVAIEARLNQAVDNIDRVIRDLRNYIFGLRPGMMADRQLDEALRRLAADFEEGGSTRVEVRTDPDAVSLLAGRAPNVIQAAREAVSNAVRHASASTVTLSLERRGEAFVLEVTDDGKGFDITEVTGTGHGLGNLQARASQIGGTLMIDSQPGRGTSVRIVVPI